MRGRGRLQMTWNLVVENDMRECGLNKVNTQDRVNLRRLVLEPTSQLPHKK